MTEDQIKAGDHMLKFLLSNNGFATTDDYRYSLKEKGFTEIDIRMAILSLEDRNFITHLVSNSSIRRLTAEGYKAAEMGLENYFKKIEERDLLNVKMMKATIYGAKWSKYSAYIAIGAALITIFLTILNMLKLL